MNTTFYNVGHGEAIFIQLENGRGIVRDFGRARCAQQMSTSCSPAALLCCCRFARKQYIPMVRNRKLDAVLSHAHEDHFNGFKMIRDMGRSHVFENAYIPWLSMKDLNDLGGLLIKCSLLLYRHYKSTGLIASNAKNWLIAAPVMACISRKLWCVSAGHSVKEWDANKFLWPPVPLQNYQEKLKQKWDAYLSKNDSSPLFLELLNNDSAEILGVLREFYPAFPTDQTGSEISSEGASEAIDAISTILEREEGRKLGAQMSSPKALYPIYKCALDDHSLIFEIGTGKEKSLFLSDADDPAVGRMLELNEIHGKHYQLIKSGHHGNRGAKKLLKHNVTSGVVVNCCGPASKNLKGPDRAYLRVSTGNIICTDWNDNGAKWEEKASYKISKTCRIVL